MSFKNTISRIGRRGTVVASAVAAGSAITAMPAVAGANCDPGLHCLFFSDVNSSKHQYFGSVTNFNGDTFSGGNGDGSGQPVGNNSWAVSNSSNLEIHYYDGANWLGFLFCLSPGATVHSLPSSLRDRISSIRLMPPTSGLCLSN